MGLNNIGLSWATNMSTQCNCTQKQCTKLMKIGQDGCVDLQIVSYKVINTLKDIKNRLKRILAIRIGVPSWSRV